MTASGHLVWAEIHGRLRGWGGRALWQRGAFEGEPGRNEWSLSKVLQGKVLTSFHVLRHSHEHWRRSCQLPPATSHTVTHCSYTQTHTRVLLHLQGPSTGISYSLPSRPNLNFYPKSCSYFESLLSNSNLKHMHWIKTTTGKEQKILHTIDNLYSLYLQ